MKTIMHFTPLFESFMSYMTRSENAIYITTDQRREKEMNCIILQYTFLLVMYVNCIINHFTVCIHILNCAYILCCGAYAPDLKLI